MIGVPRSLLRTVSATANPFSAAVTAIPRFLVPRQFSSSSCRYQVEPTFAPSSTSELDDLLKKGLDTVIVPGHLTRAQRSYVFSEKNKLSLEIDPVIVHINGDPISVKYLNMHRDLLPKRKLAGEIIRKAETEADWENVLLYLRLSNLGKPSRQGESSGISRLPVDTLERFVRQALHFHQPRIVMQALLHADTTKVILGQGQILFLIIRGLRNSMAELEMEDETPAIESLEMIDQFIKHYDAVYYQMEQPVHQIVKQADVESPQDLRIQPWVIAPMMELLAISMPLREVEKLLNEQTKYGRFLVRLLSMLNGFPPTPVVISEDATPNAIRRIGNSYIGRWESVYSALKLAQRLSTSGHFQLSATQSQDVESLSEQIKTNLNEAATKLAEIGYRPKNVAAPGWRELMRWSRTGEVV